LFEKGIQAGGATPAVSFGTDRRFEMGQEDPGSVFAAFRMGIVAFSVWRFNRNANFALRTAWFSSTRSSWEC
jgi:hypothetical protein